MVYRILCILTAAQTHRLLEQVSSALEAALGPALDLRFPDAPHPASGPAQDAVQTAWPGVPYFEWWDKGADGKYAGVETTLDYIRDYEQMHGPFEGVVGFSQGGALAALLSSQTSAAAAPALPSLRFALVMSGFCPADPLLKAQMTAAAPFRVPATLIFGKGWDFERQGTEQLAQLWASGAAKVIEHGGGHVVPRTKHPGGAAALEAVRLLAAQASVNA